MFIRILFLILLLVPVEAGADGYVFYLHGRIVEGSDGRPTHPEYGVYEYPAIVAAFEGAGFTVISEIRPSETDGVAYARRVTAQIDSLIDRGVSPEQISVVGMSKGGGIALATSVQLARPDVNFVLMGTCYAQPENMPPLRMRGRVLLLHEFSDPVTRPCTENRPPADAGLEFRRLRVYTGKGHGAFFEPDPVWLEPAIAWCRPGEDERRQKVRRMFDGYRDDFPRAPTVSTDSLAAWLARDEAILVDVRKSRERRISRIPGSITREEYERGDFGDRRVVSYCTIGYRSGQYTEELRREGVDAWNLEAGILGWVHSFRPVERDGREVRRVHVYGRTWNLAPPWYEAVW